MENNIFKTLTEDAINERLDNVLLHDKRYRKAQKKIDSLREELDKLELPKEQRLIINRLIASYVESGCCYGVVTYQQGLKDCALLLREMELIK